MKIVLETMNGWHCMGFVLIFVATMTIVFAASFFTEPMFNYNAGDSYTCAQNYYELIRIPRKPEQIQQECVSEALHRDGFIWLGRLSNLKVENQLLLIYGYGERPVNHSTSMEVERFTVNYTAKVRGKNSKDNKWKAIDYNA